MLPTISYCCGMAGRVVSFRRQMEKIILMWLTPGDIFGGAALVSRPSHYLFSTEAVRDSIVLIWERSKIRALAQRFPQLLENALLIALDYFSWYTAAHAALISQSARERLAHILFGLAHSIGQKVSGGIEIDVTNEELANSANITPYTTSRMISDWQKHSAIRKRPGEDSSPLLGTIVSPGRLILNSLPCELG
jgi:CRP-like cAMP-binding protein